MAKVHDREKFQPTHRYKIPCLNGELDFDPNSHVAKFRAKNVLLYLNNVERISNVDDGSFLLTFGEGTDQSSLLLDSTGRVYIRRLRSPELPAEPVVDADSLGPDGALPHISILTSFLKRRD